MRSFFFAFAAGVLCAQEVRLVERRVPAGEVRGAALAGAGEVWTWGEELTRWRLPELKPEPLGRMVTKPGGCLFDLDRDGLLDLIAPTAQGLVWFRAPKWQAVVMDAEAQTFDCVGADLLGHRGVLVVHLGMQVRFYEMPAGATGRWPYREIYSFYTASHQAGLLLEDVDGDGWRDVFCGNYWIRSPQSFELPWTLYAINTWSEQPESAAARLALQGRALVWAESRMSPARLAVFRRPLNPRILWEPTVFDLSAPLAYPQALAVWQNRFVLVGENHGAASRLVLFREDGKAKVVDRGFASHTALPVQDGVVLVGDRQVAYYRIR